METFYRATEAGTSEIETDFTDLARDIAPLPDATILSCFCCL